MKRTVYILLVVILLFSASCGIRPIIRNETNLPNWVTTIITETDPPESAETVAPETTITTTDETDEFDYRVFTGYGRYPEDYTPRKGWTSFVYFVDPAYLKDNTLGYYYLQHKQTGLYLGVSSNSMSYHLNLTMHPVLNQLEYATKLRVVALDNGYYGLITAQSFPIYSTPIVDPHPYMLIIMSSNAFEAHEPHWGYYTVSDFIIRKTESGAYTITTSQSDKKGLVAVANYESLGYDIENYYSIFMRPYTPDSDYSDEWLFIPADPPETPVGTMPLP